MLNTLSHGDIPVTVLTSVPNLPDPRATSDVRHNHHINSLGYMKGIEIPRLLLGCHLGHSDRGHIRYYWKPVEEAVYSVRVRRLLSQEQVMKTSLMLHRVIRFRAILLCTGAEPCR